MQKSEYKDILPRDEVCGGLWGPQNMADLTIDAKGTNCPIPILKAKKAISTIPKGAVLEILATDPGAIPDFQAFCRATGNTLVEHSEVGGVYTFLIKHTSA